MESSPASGPSIPGSFQFLDIGGEGRHPRAVNVNPCRTKTVGPQRGAPIPRLLVARADALPLADASVRRIVVERTPLSNAALEEIARVLAPGGTLILRHVPWPDGDRHARARARLRGATRQRRFFLGAQQVQETRIRVGTRIREAPCRLI